jgi:transcriptional regulator with XRE-family HTH domain
MKNENRIIQIDDICIGENIRTYRLKAGFKQTALVKQLQLSGYDISTYSYNRIEKGTQNPTVSLLLNLCRILSCDMNDLFGL